MEEPTQESEGGSPEAQEPAAEAGQTGQAGPSAESQALMDELSALGEKFVELLRVAWNSEQRKEIEKGLRTGLNSVATNLEDGFRKVSENPQTKEVIGKAETVAESVGEKVRASKVTQELTEGLRKGLAALAEQMEHWSQELKEQEAKRSAESTTGASETAQGAAQGPEQDIPIDDQR